MKKMSLIRIKKFAIYAKKDLLLMMTIKDIIKEEIIAILQENIEELLITCAI